MNLNLHVRDKVGLFLTLNPLSRYLFGRNRSIIYNRSITRKIIEHFGGDEGHQIDSYFGNLGFGLIHYSFILNLKPERILCIGSRKGFIPAICALACQENSKGVVDFVDAGYDENHSDNWSGIGWWKKIDPQKHFSFLDVNQYLKTYIMTTRDFANKYHYRYQYIYVDGDHSYNGVKTDYNLFWPRLENGGFMVFHDAYVRYTRDLGHFGVWKLFKEIKIINKIIFPFPKESGLGILQKN